MLAEAALEISVRDPDLILDGWALDDGEQLHEAAPDTFEIPPLWVREALEVGDFAQLVFKISFADDEPETVERMWVVVNGTTPAGYLGILNNNPYCLVENDFLWSGTELPFEPRHVIDVSEGNAKSLAIAQAPPKIPWPPPSMQ